MSDFAVKMDVRAYDVDSQGHLNSAIYQSYAEHARWSYLLSIGITPKALIGSGVGPVFLELAMRFRHELLFGDAVDVTCAFVPREDGSTRTFKVLQQFVLPDDTIAAELECVCGLLDLDKRKLIDNPLQKLAEISNTGEIELVETGAAAP
jgi:acyl-CoA thioester hydrolase